MLRILEVKNFGASLVVRQKVEFLDIVVREHDIFISQFWQETLVLLDEYLSV